MFSQFFRRCLITSHSRVRIEPANRFLSVDSLPKQSFCENGKFTGFIPMDRIIVSYCRSSGPGGQFVQKVETKVDLRFHFGTADWLTDAVRERLRKLKPNHITKDDYFVMRSELTRYRHLNLANVLDKLRNLIREACTSLDNDVKKPLSSAKQAEIADRLIKSNLNRLKFKRLRSEHKASSGAI